MKNTKSVIVNDLCHCVMCGKDPAQIHHIFFGVSNRKIADKDGYIIPLCLEHHTGQDGIHFDKKLDIYWKQIAQRHYELDHSREEFIERYGRSYL